MLYRLLFGRFFVASAVGGLSRPRSIFICHRFATSKSERFTKKIKYHRSSMLYNMADPEFEKILVPLRASVKEQGDLVRQLKSEDAPEIDVKKAVAELKLRKNKLEETELKLAPKENQIDRYKLEDLLKRRFFIDQSFSIYGGVTGFYDFGPMGCAMKSNMLQMWRNHFVLEEGMLEVECAMITPEPVLKASGHVDRFSDYMVKDLKTGECFRADHLIKAHAEKMLTEKDVKESTKDELMHILAILDGFSREDMESTITKYNMKSMITGNDLSPPIPFNLMFPTSIGPAGNISGFLRPETAQGIFVNFKRLLEFNQGRLPFAAAQIGAGFRNEISPRQGLIRVREFTMAEIEHFVDPDNKDHHKFDRIRDYECNFFSACDQMDAKPMQIMSVGQAVDSKMVANQTLGYYLARVHQFMIKVGVNPDRLRFRQHMSNEMAHYACDCWDAECLTSYGWVECVGNADRSCFDLTQHSKASGVKLVAERRLNEPKDVNFVQCVANKGLIGKELKDKAKLVIPYLEKLDSTSVAQLEKELQENSSTQVTVHSQKFTITSEMINIKRGMKKIHVEEIVPSVIEPSFGIGRIMYAVFEHNFKLRQGDEQRQFLALPPLVAPTKCSVLPLSNKLEFAPICQKLCDLLLEHDISYKIDDSGGSIGKRYARTDEIGIPFGCTVDFDSLKEPHTATLRERDSMEQIRASIEEISCLVRDLSRRKITWQDVMAKYPRFEGQEAAK